MPFDPKITVDTATAGEVKYNSEDMTKGTVGSLAANEYDYGDNDSLGFDTVYVKAPSDWNDPPTDKTNGVSIWGSRVVGGGSGGGGGNPSLPLGVTDRTTSYTGADQQGDGLRTTSPTNFIPSGETITITGWMYNTTGLFDHYILEGYDTPSGHQNFRIYEWNNPRQLGINIRNTSGGTYVTANASGASENEWLFFIWEGTPGTPHTFNLYKLSDGLLDFTMSTGFPSGSPDWSYTDLNIHNNRNSNRSWNGRLANLTLHNRSLTSEEKNLLFNGEIGVSASTGIPDLSELTSSTLNDWAEAFRLNETSGTRAGIVGDSLSDINTLDSIAYP